MPTNVFLNGEYLKKVPAWHIDDSAWKARGILTMLQRTGLAPRNVGEVGCGCGEVLRQLQQQMDPACVFRGYDIAPEAIQLSQTRQNARLRCQLGDICEARGIDFDLLLVLDVLEHQENYFQFLRDIKPVAPLKIFHSVLDLSVRALLQADGLTRRRASYDDLHFFTKDTLLQSLRGEAYEVLDWFYFSRSVSRASGLRRVGQWPRRLLHALSPDAAARLLGGFSIYVLAR